MVWLYDQEGSILTAQLTLTGSTRAENTLNSPLRVYGTVFYESTMFCISPPSKLALLNLNAGQQIVCALQP